MNCRHCNTELETIFCDLQTCPPSNAMVKFEELNEPEKYYPLKVFVCSNCWLVQTDEIKKADQIFNDEYTYFSSFSSSWLEHSKKYVNYMINRFSFNEHSKIVEIASNDGYLLQYFKAKNIKTIGVEPTANTAEVAIEKGIDTIIDFFSAKLAKNLLKNYADLIVGNNVLAHVPDINDFVKGLKIALKKKGIITMEFPHLLKLIEGNQFDTIYHEHFSYLSLCTVKKIFNTYGLKLFDVEKLNSHGGSLRIFATHDNNNVSISQDVINFLEEEKKFGLLDLKVYLNFQNNADRIRDNFIRFLLKAKKEKKKVVGYGAAAKGNTLLNYAGIKKNDIIKFVIDKSPFKQNKFLPGSRLPVKNKENLKEYKPDFIIIFPWNLEQEVIKEHSYVKEWGCQFVVFIPKLKFI